MKASFKAALLLTAALSTPAVFADDSGVAAGSDVAGANVASGTVATIVALSVGVGGIVGAVIAGSSSKNGTSTSTSTSTAP
jgi:hypothetical protein